MGPDGVRKVGIDRRRLGATVVQAGLLSGSGPHPIRPSATPGSSHGSSPGAGSSPASWGRVSRRHVHISVMQPRDRGCALIREGAGAMTAAANIQTPFAAPPGAPAKPHLDHPLDRWVLIGCLTALVLGLLTWPTRSIGHLGVRRRTDDDSAVPPARRGVADRARLRIRQRLPRHRQRRRHCHLHPRPAGSDRGRVVGPVEPPRRPRFERRRRVHHRFAVAGRTHSPGRVGRRLRNGVRAAHRRDHLESRHMVAWHSRLELAHPDRLDCRRWRRQCDDARPERHRRRGLGSGTDGRQGAPFLALCRLCPLGAAAAGDEDA